MTSATNQVFAKDPTTNQYYSSQLPGLKTIEIKENEITYIFDSAITASRVALAICKRLDLSRYTLIASEKSDRVSIITSSFENSDRFSLVEGHFRLATHPEALTALHKMKILFPAPLTQPKKEA